MQTLSFLAVFTLLLLFSAPACADDNLLSNGDFERDETSLGYAWMENNWAHNDATMKVVTDNPHSGLRCQEMTLTRASNADNIQLVQQTPKVIPGKTYQITFWIRGSDNCRPIDVNLGQTYSPYTLYSMAQVSYGSDWSQHTVFLKMADDGRPDQTGVLFLLRQETTIWIDDVTMTVAPPRSTAPLVEGNVVPNGSFEVGRDKWTAGRPPWSWNDFHGMLPLVAGDYDDWNIESVSVADAPHGKRALHFKLSPTRAGVDTLDLTSVFFPLRYGYPAQVSFWLKAEKPGGQIWAAVSNGENPTLTEQASTFNISNAGWQYYHFTIDQVGISTAGLYFFHLKLSQPGDFWLDAVSVQDAAQPTAGYVSRASNVGWEQEGPKHVGNLYQPGEDIRFRILAEKSGPDPVHLVGHVVDLFGREAKTLDLTLTGDDRAETVLDDLPRKRLGPYKIELFNPGANFTHDIPLVDLQYQVLPKLPPLTQVKDRFFGSHAGTLGPAELRVAELVGVRSIRFNGPELTKWAFIEPDPGKFLFDEVVPSISRASRKGFDLFGDFDLTATWAADYEDGEFLSWRGKGSYPPKDWATYRNYVQQDIRILGPYVHSWEVWNEPDLDESFDIPKSWTQGRDQLVEKMVEETRQAVDEIHSDAIVNGVADYGLNNNRLVDQLMDLKVWSHLDGATFHSYATDVSGLEGRIAQLQQQLDRHGKPVQIWMTEGANTIRVDTWLRSLRIPDATPELALQQAAGTIRNITLFKAMGVKRYYTYPGPLNWQGGRNINDNAWAFGDDVLANPLPSWSAHAACVLFLEDTAPDPKNAIEHLMIGGVAVTLLHFNHDDGRQVTVAWAKTPVKVADVPEIANSALHAYDLCGNSIASFTSLDSTPVYLVP